MTCLVVATTNMAAIKRFAHFSEQEIQNKRVKATPSNTIRANEKAANAFRQYLLEKEEESTDFERFSAEDLNRLLQRYYFEA